MVERRTGPSHTITTAEHTDHDMLSHCIHCLYFGDNVRQSEFKRNEKHEAWSDILSVIIRTSHSFYLSQPPNAGFYGDTGSLKIVSAPINLSTENIYMSIFCHVTVVKEYKFSRFNREFSVYSFC